MASCQQTLTVKKTKYMVFHTPQRKMTYPEIKINNILLERISEFSLLGIIFYSNLKWHTHINYITKNKYWNCWTIMEIKRPTSDDCVTDAL